VAALSLRGLEKVYPNGFKAVHGIDLEVGDGEFMVFVGPSGCAKSTVLRMIAGLESISGGELRIGNRVVNNVPAKQRGIAMVFQNYALYPHMTVYGNLAFGLQLAGLKKPEIDRRVHEAAELLEMGHLLDRYPKQLSGGQAQRVAVGRAIVKKPDVFLFDEPLSNLDAKLRAAMRVRLTELHQTLRAGGVASTVIYVTHDQTEAMTMGERICVLREGRIQQVDTPTTLYQHPANAFVAGFIGSPEMNLHPAEVVETAGGHVLQWGGVTLPLGDSRTAAWRRAGAPAQVQLGLRPEHLSLLPVEGRSHPLPAELRFAEHMGSEIFVHLTIGARPFTCRLPADAIGSFDTGTRGRACTVHAVPDMLHLFSADGGTSLL
jgi:oligogalacturonide transport system ATP-binding protein